MQPRRKEQQQTQQQVLRALKRERKKILAWVRLTDPLWGRV